MIQQHREQQTLLEHIETMAADVGRLRRVTLPETSACYALDRISNTLEAMDAALQPTAADLYRIYVCVSGDQQISVEEALRVTDKRARRLRELLGASGQDELAAQIANATRERVAA